MDRNSEDLHIVIEGYFLEGGYVTQEKGLNSDVKIRKNGGTMSNLPTVDIIEELD
ncbi:MAG: hypothetical protein R6V35_03505 [Candidatus Nanohaloarchaea archaeon]